MAYIAGPFTLTIKIGGGSHTSAGGTESGITISEDRHVQQIMDDEHGDVPIDGVNRGSSVTIRFTANDWEAVKAAIYASFPQGNPKSKIGHLVKATAVEIKATPVAGTSAATLDGIFTFYKCVMETNLDVLLGTGLRKADLVFTLYPDSANSYKLYDPAAPV